MHIVLFLLTFGFSCALPVFLEVMIGSTGDVVLRSGRSDVTQLPVFPYDMGRSFKVQS